MRRFVLSLWNVMRKELIQVFRDRRQATTLILAPVLQLVLLGNAINLQVDHVPTVVCDQDRSEISQRLTKEFFANQDFKLSDVVLNPSQAQTDLESGKAAVALIFPPRLQRGLGRNDGPAAQVIVDGADPTRAQVAVNEASVFLTLNGLAGTPMIREEPGPTIMPRIFYNPTLSTTIFMLAGMFGMLLLNITAIQAAMGLAREKEAGTLEQVMVTPIRPVVFLAGKSLPYILFGLVDVMAVLVVGNLAFGMPLRGSFVLLGFASFLYLFTTLGFGIFLATISNNQQQAMLGAFAFMMPASLLSGFMTPIASMPGWLQPLTLLDPLRHYIEIARGVLLKGGGLGDFTHQLLWLALLGAVLLWASVTRFQKRHA